MTEAAVGADLPAVRGRARRVVAEVDLAAGCSCRRCRPRRPEGRYSAPMRAAAAADVESRVLAGRVGMVGEIVAGRE